MDWTGNISHYRMGQNLKFVNDSTTPAYTETSGTDLPQTGNTSTETLIITLSALAMMAAGFVMLKFSGVNRRRKDEQ